MPTPALPTHVTDAIAEMSPAELRELIWSAKDRLEEIAEEKRRDEIDYWREQDAQDRAWALSR